MKQCRCEHCVLGPNRVRVGVKLTPENDAAVRLIAALQNISVAAVIRHALAEYLANTRTSNAGKIDGEQWPRAASPAGAVSDSFREEPAR